MGASLSRALGKKEPAKVLENGGVEASEPFAEGLKDRINKEI